jgi:hypothetical protein
MLNVFIVGVTFFMLSVVMLNVVMLSVVAPWQPSIKRPGAYTLWLALTATLD